MSHGGGVPAEALLDLRRRLDELSPRYRRRGVLVEGTAERFGVSRAAVYRSLVGQPRPRGLRRADRGEPRKIPRAELECYSELVAALKLRTSNLKCRRVYYGDQVGSTSTGVRVVNTARTAAQALDQHTPWCSTMHGPDVSVNVFVPVLQTREEGPNFLSQIRGNPTSKEGTWTKVPQARILDRPGQPARRVGVPSTITGMG